MGTPLPIYPLAMHFACKTQRDEAGMAGHCNSTATSEFPDEPDNLLASGGVWHHGDLLVMSKHAELPHRCIKSNEPTESVLRRHLIWHPFYYCAILIVSPIAYIIVAMFVCQRATIRIPLSDEWRRRRRKAILFSWTGALIRFALLVVALESNLGAGFAVGVGLFLLIGSITYGVLASRMFRIVKIDKHYVWLKGVSAAYLQELPEWPGAM